MTGPHPGYIAPIKRRVIAYLIDAAIVGGGVVLLSTLLGVFVAMQGSNGLGLLTAGMAIIGILAAGWWVVYTWMQGGAGSIGMKTQKLRLVKEYDGTDLGFGGALIRNLIWGLAGSIVVGYFSTMFDKSGRLQGWHDKLAHSVMIVTAQTGSGADEPSLDLSWTNSAFEAAVRGQQPAAPASLATPAAATPAAEQPGGWGSPVQPAAQPGWGAPEQPAQPAAQPGWGAPAQPAQPGWGAPEQPAQPAAQPGWGAPEQPAQPAAQPAWETPAQPVPGAQPAGWGAPEQPAWPGAEPTPAPTPAVAPESYAAHAAQLVEPQAEAPAPAASAPPNDSSLIASVPGITQSHAAIAADLDAEAAAHPATHPAPVVDEEAALDDTVVSTAPRRVLFTWDDGTAITVTQRTVFGRNPAEEDGAMIVAVRDTSLSLSKTHFEAGVDASGAWVVDRHSTNGTVVVRGEERTTCNPGVRTPVRVGDVIEFGDRTLTVGSPS